MQVAPNLDKVSARSKVGDLVKLPLLVQFLSCGSRVEGCQVQKPTTKLRVVRVMVSSYLHCMEVGTISLLQGEGI